MTSISDDLERPSRSFTYC